MSWVGTYIGIPYEDHGRTRDGCDCWGLVRLVLRERFRVHDLPDPAYDDHRDPRLAQMLRQPGESWLPALHPRAGDVVVLRVRGRPNHVGVMVDGHRMLHVERGGSGAVVEDLRGSRWSGRVEGVYRHAELARIDRLWAQ